MPLGELAGLQILRQFLDAAWSADDAYRLNAFRLGNS